MQANIVSLMKPIGTIIVCNGDKVELEIRMMGFKPGLLTIEKQITD